MSSTLKNKKAVSGVIAGSGGPFWKEAMEQSMFHASKIDKAGIKFALIENGNLLSVYVSEEDFERAEEALKQ